MIALSIVSRIDRQVSKTTELKVHASFPYSVLILKPSRTICQECFCQLRLAIMLRTKKASLQTLFL